jgi:hypothetical protein
MNKFTIAGFRWWRPGIVAALRITPSITNSNGRKAPVVGAAL